MGTTKFVSTKPARLTNSVDSTSTSITVDKIQDRNGNVLSMSDFGDTGWGVFEPGSDNEEHFTFTAISSNTLTISRDVSMKSPYTASGTGKPHASGTRVVLYSNTPAFYSNFVHADNDQNIYGQKTFDASNYPKMDDGTTPPVNDGDLTPRWWVLSQVNGGDVTVTGNVVNGVSRDANIVAGSFIYFSEGDSGWVRCDADTASTVDATLLGIAQGSGATTGSNITGGILMPGGYDDNQSGLTANAPVYASNTAGGISSSAGTTVVKLGYAISDTEIIFDPRFDTAPTTNEKGALPGSGGTPGSSNKYITQRGLQLSTEVYGASSTGNDTYTITMTPTVTSLTTGNHFFFKADVANTGACTLKLDSLPSVTIKKNGTADLGDGDIKAGQIVHVIYDGTNFQLLGFDGNVYSDGDTGGTGSAGAGNQYVEMEIGGTVYKILHDGTV